MRLSELKILFIGDSITEGFNNKHFLPELNIRNEGVSGDRTDETFDRINPEWFNPQPDLIFLCIGTNDIARGRTDIFIVQAIDSILHKIFALSPRSKLIVTSIFPTYSNEERSNQRIVEINKRLNLLCDNRNILYFHLHRHFTDEFGQLRINFTDDGLHLNDEGYKQWAVKLFEFISLININ